MRSAAFVGCALLLAVAMQAALGADKWNADNGKPAPPLTGAGWIGTPVSMDAVKGNTVVLAFWNADVAC